MADDNSALLDSREAIKKCMTPMGRKLGIVMDDPGGYPFYTVKYVDDKQGGIPDELSGRWTTLASCKNDLSSYLHKIWAMSDAQKAKASKPLAYTNNGKPESKSASVQ